MQLSEILTYAGVALVVALVYNMSHTSGDQSRSTLVIVAMIILVVLAYMLTKDKDNSPGKKATINPRVGAGNGSIIQDDEPVAAHDPSTGLHTADRVGGFQSYDEYGQESYTDMEERQNMQNRMEAIVPNTMRGEGFRDVPTGVTPAAPERKEASRSGFKPFADSDTEYAMPMSKRQTLQASNPDQKAVQGNYLDVSSKDADTHGQVGTNSALLPIMEQYMKVHENDPTRTSIWQSNNGVPSYDLRDPINVKLNDFPRTVSAKLPVV